MGVVSEELSNEIKCVLHQFETDWKSIKIEDLDDALQDMIKDFKGVFTVFYDSKYDRFLVLDHVEVAFFNGQEIRDKIDEIKGIDLISREIDDGGQSIIYTEILNVESFKHSKIFRKFRIRIRKDVSYNKQSLASIYVWNDGWVFLHDISYSSMKTKNEKTFLNFREDRDELLRVARAVLSK